jgi:hypothetical protein
LWKIWCCIFSPADCSCGTLWGRRKWLFDTIFENSYLQRSAMFLQNVTSLFGIVFSFSQSEKLSEAITVPDVTRARQRKAI